MFRIALLLFSFTLLQAKNIPLDYSIEFGMFGEIAHTKAMLSKKRHSYVLEVNLSVTHSIAKSMSNNLREQHISKGHISNGLLITDMFQIITYTDKFTSTSIYQVDHKKKRIRRQYKKWVKGKKITDKKRVLGYYGRDDLLTFFLNLHKHIKQKAYPKNYQFQVIGADNKNGRVDFNIPNKKSMPKLKKLLGTSSNKDWYGKVTLHRKIYGSKKGEMNIRIDKYGLMQKAILKDLVLFGDVRIIKK